MCAKDRVFKGDILERTMASVPNWSEMRHSAPRPRNFNDSAAADCLVKKPS